MPGSFMASGSWGFLSEPNFSLRNFEDLRLLRGTALWFRALSSLGLFSLQAKAGSEKLQKNLLEIVNIRLLGGAAGCSVGANRGHDLARVLECTAHASLGDEVVGGLGRAEHLSLAQLLLTVAFLGAGTSILV